MQFTYLYQLLQSDPLIPQMEVTLGPEKVTAMGPNEVALNNLVHTCCILMFLAVFYTWKTTQKQLKNTHTHTYNDNLHYVIKYVFNTNLLSHTHISIQSPNPTKESTNNSPTHLSKYISPTKKNSQMQLASLPRFCQDTHRCLSSRSRVKSLAAKAFFNKSPASWRATTGFSALANLGGSEQVVKTTNINTLEVWSLLHLCCINWIYIYIYIHIVI